MPLGVRGGVLVQRLRQRAEPGRRPRSRGRRAVPARRPATAPRARRDAGDRAVVRGALLARDDRVGERLERHRLIRRPRFWVATTFPPRDIVDSGRLTFDTGSNYFDTVPAASIFSVALFDHLAPDLLYAHYLRVEP